MFPHLYPSENEEFVTWRPFRWLDNFHLPTINFSGGKHVILSGGKHITGWWFLTYFLFSPSNQGEDSYHFDLLSYVSDGLVKNHQLYKFSAKKTWEFGPAPTPTTLEADGRFLMPPRIHHKSSKYQYLAILMWCLGRK